MCCKVTHCSQAITFSLVTQLDIGVRISITYIDHFSQHFHKHCVYGKCETNYTSYKCVLCRHDTFFCHPFLKLTSWKAEPVFFPALYFDELLKQLTYIPCNDTRCKNIPGGMIISKPPWTANCAVGVHSGVQMCYEHPPNKSCLQLLHCAQFTS